MTGRRRRSIILLAGIAVLGLVCVLYALLQRRQAAAELASAGQTLHRLISQRADQHDAHLTSLSALVQAADPAPIATVEQVAASITRFYPRIVGIDVVDLATTPPASLLDTTDPAVVAAEATQASGASVRTRTIDGGTKLLLVKRALTDGVGHYAIALIIDIARLSASDVALPEGAGAELGLAEHAEAGRTAAFSAEISSRTQPLRLSLTTTAPRWPAPPPAFLIVAALLTALGALLVDRLLEARARASDAARKAALATQDARLAHAGRVNAMGELASGIAHELTQPLTAILSQAQAGQRLLQRPGADPAALAPAFDAIARNAKRAGEILGRLRAWISKSEPDLEIVDLADLASEVTHLLTTGALPDRTALKVESDGSRPQVRADRVQLEQVVFNLGRNALDAVAEAKGERIVTIAVATRGRQAVLSVADTGPGLSPEAQARLFEPFFTTKPGGLGLGLALCNRLIERFGGALDGRNADGGGAVLSFELPLAAEAVRREAAE
jgi:C4-dicarboxylate-specific signal transduction histidine kinase